MKMVERFHGELIPAQETRQAKLEDDVTEWVDVTIPETIDRLTGAIARKLQKVLGLCRNQFSHAIDDSRVDFPRRPTIRSTSRTRRF